ncbi:lysophosphatidylcholine acyltransferase 1-like [Babylonia areolata]|uniref:lysophosphatidylcholine acyltransferase 1-like n=1 Tax=Babylonia areolata TaxID=304850 RepID=UPI003FD18CA4
MKEASKNQQQNAGSKTDALNPFYHRLHLSGLDLVKIAVMSVTVAPIRLLLVGLLLLMIWPLAAIAVAFRRPEDRGKPLAGWRCILGPLIVLLSRGVFFVGGFKWIRVRGQRASAEEAPILVVAPHSSFLDSLALVYMGLTSVVAKAESQHIPCFGKIIQFSQPVLVSRDDPDSRQNTIKEIQRRSQSGGKWPQIFIFPEGTCSNRSCLISFKGGAFFPGVPVQPVCLRYHNNLDTMTWTWDGPGAFQCLWLTLCQIQSHMEIEFLPVYKPSQAEISDPKLFASNVRHVMAQHLQIPVTDHTYPCRRRTIHIPQKLRLPMEAGITQFQKLHRQLGLSDSQMKETLHRLQTMDHHSTDDISLLQFASFLHLPQSSALHNVFCLYDRDQSGRIDFREYVIGLSLVCNPDNADATLQCAFQLFDGGHKGYITKEELQTILHKAFALNHHSAARLFHDIDTDQDGRITFEDFKKYAAEKPDFARQFEAGQPSPPPPTANGHRVGERGDTEDCDRKPLSSPVVRAETNGLHKRAVAT